METTKANKWLTTIIGILLVFAMLYIAWQNKVEQRHQNSNTLQTAHQPGQSHTAKDIQITTPLNAPLSGIAVIAGAARLVYFEGSFPAELLDAQNQTVWQGPATAQGDWMTSEYVPFLLSIPTMTIQNGTYTLKLQQDDPSGEIPTDQLYTVSVPVTVQN